MKFSAMVVFSTLFLLFIYTPLAHWIWGGGWLAQLGALDFAGGAVVHISCAAAALACVHVLGPRLGFHKGETASHNLPMTVLGMGLLWFGWFGFNGGRWYCGQCSHGNASGNRSRDFGLVTG